MKQVWITGSGATTIGTASAGKHERLKQMCCGHCIDYRSRDVEREVLDLTAGRGGTGRFTTLSGHCSASLLALGA